MTEYSIIKACPITDSTERLSYFNLGNFPLVNNLNESREDSLNCKRFPLEVTYYPSSGLSALTHAVNGELLFCNYLFKSGVNIPYIEHCKNMFTHINKYVRLANNDAVIDIGGNEAIQQIQSIAPKLALPAFIPKPEPWYSSAMRSKSCSTTKISSPLSLISL